MCGLVFRITTALGIIFCLLLSGCSFNNYNKKESSWDIPMKDKIEDEYVTYNNNTLTIDGHEVELPEGKQLYVRYKVVNGVVHSTVKVDGQVVPQDPEK